MIAHVLAVLYCFWRQFHNPKRQAFGGQRCVDCGKALGGYQDAGTMTDDHVSSGRAIFSRGATDSRGQRHHEYERWPRRLQ